MFEELKDTIEKMNNEVTKNIKRLNWGGCGEYAYYVAVQLRELLGHDKVFTIVEGYDSTSVDEVVANNDINEFITVDRWFRESIHFHHVRVVVKDDHDEYVIDSEDILSGSEYSRYLSNRDFYNQGEIPLDLLKPLLGTENVGGWNTMFSRKQIPKLRKIVDKYLLGLHGNSQVQSA